jgi:hypothetical protein
MGHERVGILPKSARWTRLVHQMGGIFASEVPVGALAACLSPGLSACVPTWVRQTAVGKHAQAGDLPASSQAGGRQAQTLQSIRKRPRNESP